ncbi:MAG: excinuclease ABC subunit UvrC [Lachnospiraceae bacterium]
MSEKFDIKEELKKLPNKPGVYLMKDKNNQIIYVGKAINLKNRVRSYFRESTTKSIKIENMVPLILEFEYIVTDSELEALVLENNLIKEYNPKYNTLLKDDKTYPFIKVTDGEEFPRVLFSREMKKDKSRYYGPFSSSGAVKDTIELIHKLFFVRTCNKNLPKDIGKSRPCLNYHIKQCFAPCQGNISKEDYKLQIEKVHKFLNGEHKPILLELEEKMKKAAEKMEFEEAANYRDLMESVAFVAQRQRITQSHGEDRDIIAIAKENMDAVVQVFFIRNGRLIGREHFYMRNTLETQLEEIVQSFITQFYAGTPFIPKELLLQLKIEDTTLIEEWLTSKRGSKVKITTPQKGEKEKLVELAIKNAKMVLDSDRERLKREEGRTIGAVKEIAQSIGLEHIERMEAYDISNTNGYENVGSMVVFEKGKSKNSDYRKFKIKSIEGPDDYGCMKEVLTRRFSHGLKERQEEKEYGGFTKFPDLILMDGGLGQVNIAIQVLEELKIHIPVCGMVKDDNHNTRGLLFQNKEIPLAKNSEGFRLITRIQDEAHRFAVSYHRSLRSKGQVHSILDEIPGIGATRRKALMRHFDSVNEIKNASIEELSQVPNIPENIAKEIYSFFHNSMLK